VFIISFL